MILVDTSVWIDHFRVGNPELALLLTEKLVVTHPFVAGELACGNLRRREETLEAIALLPRAARASDEEAMQLVERHRLWGKGIGWVDGHLLASALLSNAALWTLDGRLEAAAEAAGVRRHRRRLPKGVVNRSGCL